MAKVKKISGFVCPSCDAIYTEEYDAEGCCPIDTRRGSGWQCTGCDEIYNDKEDAKECCN